MKRLLLALALFSPLAAHAYCSAPSMTLYEPSPPMKPDKPYCAMSQSCSRLDVDMYRRQMDEYVEGLKRYVREAQEVGEQYAAQALAYAKCQLRDG